MPKVNVLTARDPDEWQGELEQREVEYDLVHAELIGEDAVIERMIEEEAHLPHEPPFGQWTSWPVADEVGALQEVELMGADIDWSPDDTDLNPDIELIGDDEQEDYEETHEEGEEAPEGAPETEEDVTEMGPESDEPGPSAAPSFSAPTGTVRNAPVVSKRAIRAHALAHTIARFRSRVRAKDPVAIRGLLTLQAQAKANPASTQAVAFRVVAKPWIKASGSARFSIHGEPFISGTVAGTVTKILSLALAPVAWATHGVGTVSKGVGSQLQSLSRKL